MTPEALCLATLFYAVPFRIVWGCPHTENQDIKWTTTLQAAMHISAHRKPTCTSVQEKRIPNCDHHIVSTSNPHMMSSAKDSRTKAQGDHQRRRAPLMSSGAYFQVNKLQKQPL